MVIAGCITPFRRPPGLVVFGRQQTGRIEAAVSRAKRCVRIDVAQALAQSGRLFGGRQIGLCQNQPIGDRYLLDAFGLRRAAARHSPHRRSWSRCQNKNDAAARIRPHRRQDRKGSARPVLSIMRRRKGGGGAFAPRMEVFDRSRKLTADRAADAARLQHHHRLVDTFEQMMVKTDFTEFVDQYGSVG